MALKFQQIDHKKHLKVRQTDRREARSRWLEGSGSRRSPVDIISPWYLSTRTLVTLIQREVLAYFPL